MWNVISILQSFFWPFLITNPYRVTQWLHFWVFISQKWKFMLTWKSVIWVSIISLFGTAKKLKTIQMSYNELMGLKKWKHPHQGLKLRQKKKINHWYVQYCGWLSRALRFESKNKGWSQKYYILHDYIKKFLKWQNYYKDEEQIHDGKETELRNEYDNKKGVTLRIFFVMMKQFCIFIAMSQNIHMGSSHRELNRHTKMSTSKNCWELNKVCSSVNSVIPMSTFFVMVLTCNIIRHHATENLGEGFMEHYELHLQLLWVSNNFKIKI